MAAAVAAHYPYTIYPASGSYDFGNNEIHF